MKLSIISVNITSKTSKAGKPFQSAEVVYKNTDSGKVENKNITQYSNVFKQVAEAQPGQVFDVKNEKDDAGYWQWTSFVRVTGETGAVTAAPAASASKGNWETSEERAAKQVFIIKQSSLANAVATLAVGAKTAPSTDQVIAVAQAYTDWVLGKGTTNLFETPNDIEVE